MYAVLKNSLHFTQETEMTTVNRYFYVIMRFHLNSHHQHEIICSMCVCLSINECMSHIRRYLHSKAEGHLRKDVRLFVVF